MKEAATAHSCGGSHESGPVWVVPIVFPFHPSGFARMEPEQGQTKQNSVPDASGQDGPSRSRAGRVRERYNKQENQSDEGITAIAPFR